MTPSPPWLQRPSKAHHRLHWGRFKGQILAVIGGEACFLFLGIYLNEITYFVAGAALVLIGYFFWVRRRRLRDLLINQEAVQLIGTGDYDQAALLLDKLCRHPNNGSTLAVFLTNRATTALCLGQFDIALPIYHEVLRAERGVARGVFKLQGDLFRARCADALAFYGELEAAEAMLTAPTTSPRRTLEGHQLLARTVIDARRGEWEAARVRLISQWGAAEAVYSATELKALVVVRAFVFAQTPLASEPADPIIATLQPEDINRSRWMGTHWTEIADFLNQYPQTSASFSPESASLKSFIKNIND